jgi:transposase
MFSLSVSHRFLLYRKVTDFRKGFDGLCGLVRNELGRDPSSGEVYVFINRHRNRIKLLQWQHGGFVLYYKRLEKGTITLPTLDPQAACCRLNFSDLVMMIEGISIEKVIRHPRYQIYQKL